MRFKGYFQSSKTRRLEVEIVSGLRAVPTNLKIFLPRCVIMQEM